MPTYDLSNLPEIVVNDISNDMVAAIDRLIEVANNAVAKVGLSELDAERLMKACHDLQVGVEGLARTFDYLGEDVSQNVRAAAFSNLWNVLGAAFAIGHIATISDDVSAAITNEIARAKVSRQSKGGITTGAAQREAAENIWRRSFFELATKMRGTNAECKKVEIIEAFRLNQPRRNLPTSESRMSAFLKECEDNYARGELEWSLRPAEKHKS